MKSSSSENVRLAFAHRFLSWKWVGDSASILVGETEISLSLPVTNLVPPQLMTLLLREQVIGSLISACPLNVHVLLTLPEDVQSGRAVFLLKVSLPFINVLTAILT